MKLKIQEETGITYNEQILFIGNKEFFDHELNSAFIIFQNEITQ